MAAAPPHEPFRLGMLIYDTRYRGYTLQIIALVLVMLGFAWLVDNTIKNLEALGKDFSFDFLWQPANYDINQRLIEYDSRSSNGRAALLGILNTLLVAFMGCITATIIGVAVGVLRLSNNWVVARLMTVYVEMLRNIPVLIWILMTSAVVSEFFPAPKQFRDNVPDAERASAYLDGALVLTNRGFYIPSIETAPGAGMVLAVFVLSLLAIFGYRRWAKQRQLTTGQQSPVFLVSLGLFFVPAIVAHYALGQPISLIYPELKGFNFRGGTFMRESLISLWLALSLYTSAFIAEIVRGGIMSVSKGQSEAAAALGIRPGRAMRLIILPQALRVIIPPMISNYLNLTKNSSLAIAVGYMDATGTLGGITLNQTGREMECMILLLAFYLIVSLSISSLINWYNSSVSIKER